MGRRSLLGMFGLLGVLLAFPSTGRAARPADLRIRVTSASFRVGEQGVYRVAVRNESNIVADDVIRVSATLPDGLSFRSATGSRWSCSGAGQEVQCQLMGLAQAATSEVILRVGVCNAAFPSISTTFRVDYDADPKLGNNEVTRLTAVKPGTCSEPTPTPTRRHPQATVTPSRTPTATVTPRTAVDLLLAGTSSRLFVVGSRATYRFRVVNLTSTPTSSPILLVDTLPEGLLFSGVSGDGWICQANRQVLTCTREVALAGHAESEITVTVHVASEAYPTITNHAAIFYAGDRNNGNNSVSRPTTVRKPVRRVPRPTIARPR